MTMGSFLSSRLFHRSISAAAMAIAFGLPWGRSPQGVAAREPLLLVSAASSLTEPLQALVPVLPRHQTGTPPAFNFGSSGALRQQIEKGAPVDVLIAAGDWSLNQLEHQGLLLPGSRRVLAANQLVLVVPARSPRHPLSFEGLGSRAIRRIAIGDSNVPAGDYARQTLAYYQLTEVLRPKLVPMGSVRAVANAVARGDVDAGLVYKTDADLVANLRMTATAPERSHAPIIYSAAVIKATRHPQEALAYVRSLTSSRARQEYRRFGLLLPTPVATSPTP